LIASNAVVFMNPHGREAGKPDFCLVLLGGANSPGWAFNRPLGGKHP
jgi:hypothetical protein